MLAPAPGCRSVVAPGCDAGRSTNRGDRTRRGPRVRTWPEKLSRGVGDPAPIAPEDGAYGHLTRRRQRRHPSCHSSSTGHDRAEPSTAAPTVPRCRADGSSNALSGKVAQPPELSARYFEALLELGLHPGRLGVELLPRR